ncbi:GIY-YIG nuclease family protein [Buchananella hordeovulneris]|uniref:Methionine sulfoxide reductase n=1 Tax=Buchananella hordeovulneris TaxID=52770 RepID=A0A1Q5PTY9_9ACTO|nr:GIY-YIG nuclease family protein [Buchananella hordeovulneris]OKL50939.1 methionine sulfoxide reductase [Buchananella hordeovulneris]
MRGKHIDLFLVDGEFGGIVTADVSGWTGHVVTGPRLALRRMLARWDAQTNGVYLLLGSDDSAVESLRCYIGRTESFADRLKVHAARKTWWDRVVLISSREEAFNEGYWAHLEYRMLDIAIQARRSTLDDNKQTPQPRKLSEAQQSDAEAFLEQVLSILPVLGINVLRASKPRRLELSDMPRLEASPTFRIQVPSKGVDAAARIVQGEFFLLEGSRLVSTWGGKGKSEATKRSYANLHARRDKFIADGTFRREGDLLLVTRDVAMSPSTASSLALGNSTSGPGTWRWEGGTYRDWEDSGPRA